jgi:DNA topoisomerase I
LRATGSTVVDPGFMAVYQEGQDDAQGGQRRETAAAHGGRRPGQLHKIRPEQHFTEPPPRFSEASLVRALEEHGIGRPSTYASIISTLQAREYVTLDKRRFYPTDVGRVVSKFLTNTSPSTWTTTSPRASRTNSMRSRAARRSGCR